MPPLLHTLLKALDYEAADGFAAADGGALRALVRWLEHTKARAPCSAEQRSALPAPRPRGYAPG